MSLDLRTPKLLTVAQVCEALSVTRQCLGEWRQKEVGPPWHRLGPRKIYYRSDELATWIEERRGRPPTSKPRKEPAGQF